MLAFLALLGAPYIYDISSLRVKETCTQNGHRVTYTRCIDTIDPSDDEHEVARNM